MSTDQQQDVPPVEVPELSSSRAVRVVYALLGFACLGLGIVGYVTPGWPGTVFLLIAAWLFARSNERMYRWIMDNPRFGPLIRDYRNGNGIPRRIKVIAITLMLVSAGLSAAFAIENGWVRLLVVVFALYGTWFILTRPTTEDVLAES